MKLSYFLLISMITFSLQGFAKSDGAADSGGGGLIIKCVDYSNENIEAIRKSGRIETATVSIQQSSPFGDPTYSVYGWSFTQTKRVVVYDNDTIYLNLYMYDMEGSIEELPPVESFLIYQRPFYIGGHAGAFDTYYLGVRTQPNPGAPASSYFICSINS